MNTSLISLNLPARSQGERELTDSPTMRPVSGWVEVGLHGPAGDRQSLPSQAFLAYPVEHFPFWRTVRAQARVSAWDAELAPGSLGEHLTLCGLLETGAWVGDLLRFPECELAISAPRLPDPSINVSLEFAHAASLMAANAWSGFWLSVRNPGRLKAGQGFEVVPGPREVGIAELFRVRVASSRR